MKTLRQLGEQAVIRRLAAELKPGRGVAVGIGDDCAVVRSPGPGRDWVLTTDAVIEGRHFDAAAKPAAIGHKAAARVLSDIGSMGAAPRYLLINVVAPAGMAWQRLRQIYAGIRRVCDRHGAAVIGGDTAAGAPLQLHVFGVGEAPRGKSLLRSGARAGDRLYVTGALGGSLRGRHLTFEPRVREGQFLRAWATSMIDISDGLATDLRHICDESRVGASLDSSRIPVSRDAKGLNGALRDGEDFELLFTIPARRAAAFERAWRRRFRLACTAIGVMTRSRSVRMDGAPMPGQGYEHFRA